MRAATPRLYTEKGKNAANQGITFRVGFAASSIAKPRRGKH
jgi:hypothetical protein